MTDFIIIILVLFVVAIGGSFLLMHRKDDKKIADIIEESFEETAQEIPSVEELKKLTKAKLGEFADLHKIKVDLKKKKDEIIEDIRKHF
ncbi:MAG: hypothetical protein VW270_18430 [Candidatus Poseidoniales archaeon]